MSLSRRDVGTHFSSDSKPNEDKVDVFAVAAGVILAIDVDCNLARLKIPTSWGRNLSKISLMREPFQKSWRQLLTLSMYSPWSSTGRK